MNSSEIGIFNPKIDALTTLIEESARAGKTNIKRFIEPAQGTLRRCISKRHHIIFGRRGSGKSSLLFKSADELVSNGNPVAFVDLEPFKGHQYPDIIISVLLATFGKFRKWLQYQKEIELSKRPRLYWLKKWEREKYQNIIVLINSFDQEIKELTIQLQLSDNAIIKENKSRGRKSIDKIQSKIKTGLADTSLEAEIANQLEQYSNQGHEEEFRRNKKEFLLRKILSYQTLFLNLNTIRENDAYLFLDDLYHILRKDQPDLIDYFHKISKGNNLWIKIATIRNRTSWYIHTPQPIGVKIGDDIEEINLDLTLEKFSMSKSFLKSILELYVSETSSPKISEIVSDGGIDRLVLSSGGVARDFLGLFRRSVDEARERLKRSNYEHARGLKIGAEDANVAAGTYGELKREEFQRDTLEDRNKLEEVFNKIKKFCLETTKRNIFLVDHENNIEEMDYVQELLDLRLLHQIKSRVTVSQKPGSIYRAYLLDVSQYTGERARRDVEVVDFWKESEKEKVRRASSIFGTQTNLDQDPKGKTTKKKKIIKEDPDKDPGPQMSLDW